MLQFMYQTPEPTLMKVLTTSVRWGFCVDMQVLHGTADDYAPTEFIASYPLSSIDTSLHPVASRMNILGLATLPDSVIRVMLVGSKLRIIDVLEEGDIVRRQRQAAQRTANTRHGGRPN